MMKRKRGRKCLIQIAFHVRAEDCQPLIRLHPLKQVVHFNIRVTIMAVTHLTAFTKQRVDLVLLEVTMVELWRGCSGRLQALMNPSRSALN